MDWGQEEAKQQGKERKEGGEGIRRERDDLWLDTKKVLLHELNDAPPARRKCLIDNSYILTHSLASISLPPFPPQARTPLEAHTK